MRTKKERNKKREEKKGRRLRLWTVNGKMADVGGKGDHRPKE
jgi:hypothetical protein